MPKVNLTKVNNSTRYTTPWPATWYVLRSQG